MTDIVYLVADKLGGISSLNANLMRYRPAGNFFESVVLLHDREDDAARTTERFGADAEICFEYSHSDNIYSVFRRLNASIPAGGGALVSNNSLELALYTVYEPSRTMFQIVHDEFNFRLAQTYEAVVDVMIAHSRFFYDKLVQEFSDRTERIVYLPYGIRMAPKIRMHRPGPLHLIFVGRLHQGKGVFDLPRIDKLLLEAGVDVCWTIVGDGPERNALLQTWPGNSRVRYSRPATNAEVLELCAEGDVFVSPTRFEGFPVALLEAMSAGLVPVVSDLPSGIPEVVVDGVGFRPAVEDCNAFAEFISKLAADRAILHAMSRAARKQAERFDIRDRTAAYHALFANWQGLKRPWPGPLAIKHGSRLDQPWLPNLATRSLRSLASFQTSEAAL